MRQRFVALAVTVGLLAGCGAAGIGDPYFPTYGNGGYILRAWAATNKDRLGTTPEFIDTAERMSGRQLDGLFQTWLFSPERPTVPAAAQGPAASRTTGDVRPGEWRAGLALRLAHGAR